MPRPPVTMIGSIVVEEPDPVVVTHPFVLKVPESVIALNFEGAEVMVLVAESDTALDIAATEVLLSALIVGHNERKSSRG